MRDYEQLNTMLISSGSGFHASECHGFLCALVCGNGRVQKQKIRECFLLDSDATINADEYYKHLQTLAVYIETKIRSNDFDLQLLLADEDEPLATRSRSLAEWCQGFMGGMGLSGVKEAQISSESQELIGDFYKIANLDTDCENDAEQRNDFALMELIEYVRMGAIYIFGDLQDNTNILKNHTPENYTSGVLPQ